MWTLSFVLDLAVLSYAVSSTPPSPINVTFSSVNLRNVLQWTPANGTTEDTHFTVQYAIYGDTIQGSKGKRVHWRAAQQCTDIARSWCDLSLETWDTEESYYAKVRAVGKRESSKWAITRRFDPKLDTTLGPPLVSVEMEGNNAIIDMKVPIRHQPNNHFPVVSMATLYPQLTYNLSVQIHKKTYHYPVDSNPYTYQLIHPNKKHCFSARMRLLSMPIKCQSSAWHCITTPQDPEIVHLHKVVWAIVVPSVCLCILAVVAYLLHNYLTGKGQKSRMLNSPTFWPPSLTFSPENLNLNFILVSGINNESLSDLHMQKDDLVPPYARQRPETPPEPDDLLIDYGFVGVAPQTCVEGEETARERRQDQGGDGNNLNGTNQICIAGDSYEKKKWGAGHFTGVNSPQTNSYLSQKSPHTCTHDHSPVEANGKTDRNAEEGSEAVALLSSYASQNIGNISPIHADQSDSLADDYGLLSVASAHSAEKEGEEEEEEEEVGLCINWDPETGKLVFPEIDTEAGFDEGMQGAEGSEGNLGREEVNVVGGKLKLENVLVKQASEEEVLREMERGGETGWEVDDIFTKWNVVISMDQ
ncbi:interleukin-20 receptor subunit alpha [Solea solea]|uniref:interleukin-20 receptor subunit alpha n=1 Tax=Solea solea TaxID=90069 RepID=UPI00272B0D68|nr:interleukin-20 receptor subunit alpha [Solea solea]